MSPLRAADPAPARSTPRRRFVCCSSGLAGQPLDHFDDEAGGQLEPALPCDRSLSEGLDDFESGLFRGLEYGGHVIDIAHNSRVPSPLVERFGAVRELGRDVAVL